jgi:hypothetical protein
MLHVRVTVAKANGLSEAVIESDQPLKPMLAVIREGHAVDREATELVEKVFGKEVRDLARHYTRSGATLGLLYESLMKYDHPDVAWSSLNDDVKRRLQEAMNAAYKVFGVRGLKPKPLNEVAVEPSSPGASWRLYGRPGKRTDFNVYAEGLARAETIFRRAMRRKQPFCQLAPCLAYLRTQLARRGSPKVRLVWGYPFEINLIEGSFAEPYQEVLLSRNAPILPRTKRWISMALDHVKRSGTPVGLDWSRFDSTVPRFLIRFAFGIIKKAYGAEFEGVLEMIEHYFIFTPIMMPDGRTFVKRTGIPSGSRFTALIGSIVNWVLIYAMTKGEARQLHTVGDDSLFALPYTDRKIRKMLDEWKSFAAALGMVINSDKSEIGSDVKFLGRRQRYGSTYRDPGILLLHFMLPEISGDKMEERLLGLLWDSSLNDWPIFSLYAHFALLPMEVNPREVPWPMRVAIGGEQLISVGAIFSHG